MRPLVQRWTPQEDERLKVFVAQGASFIRAAAALKRRQCVVRGRANKLGCPFPTIRDVRKKWANTPSNDWRA
jgi:GcrA cell cycle regulator